MKNIIQKKFLVLLLGSLVYGCSFEGSLDNREITPEKIIVNNLREIDYDDDINAKLKKKGIIVKKQEVFSPDTVLKQEIDNGDSIRYFEGWKVYDPVPYSVKDGALRIKNFTPRLFKVSILRTTANNIVSGSVFEFYIEPFMSYEISLSSTTPLKVKYILFDNVDSKELDSLKKLQWNITGIEAKKNPDQLRKAIIGKGDAKVSRNSESEITPDEAKAYASFIYNYALVIASDEFKRELMTSERMVFNIGIHRYASVKIGDEKFKQGDILSQGDYEKALKKHMITSISKDGTKFRNVGAEESPLLLQNILNNPVVNSVAKALSSCFIPDNIQVGLVDNISMFTMPNGTTTKGQAFLEPEKLYQKYIGIKDISLRLFHAPSPNGVFFRPLIGTTSSVPAIAITTRLVSPWEDMFNEKNMKEWKENLTKRKVFESNSPSSLFVTFFHEMGHLITKKGLKGNRQSHNTSMTYGARRVFEYFIKKSFSQKILPFHSYKANKIFVEIIKGLHLIGTELSLYRLT